MNRRIYRVILVVTAMALLAFGVPLAVVVRQLNHDEAVVRLEREAARASIEIASPASLNDGATFAHTAEHHTFGVYDVHGVRRLGAGPSRADEVVRRALTGQVSEGTDRGQLVVAVPITNNEKVFAVMRAATPSRGVTQDITHSWLLMVGLAAVILAAAAVVARLESRRLSKPVEQLAVAVTRLGDGDFTSRTTRSGVPEIDEAATALDATAERLGRLIERERSFSADASHQLRTPLTGLRLQLENAMSSPNEHRAESMEDALAAVDRLETTITDLLTLARDTGPAREPIDIGALLVELAPGWRVVAEAQGRPLAVGAEPGLPPVRVSGAAVRQVLEVLVSNALVHGRGEVTVHVGETPGGIAIDVVDEGDGITGDLEAVFGRRGDTPPSPSPAPAHDGPSGSHHGIGLPLARSLAEAEGGRLLLRNAGPRPRFSLLLPAPDAAP